MKIYCQQNDRKVTTRISDPGNGKGEGFFDGLSTVIFEVRLRQTKIRVSR